MRPGAAWQQPRARRARQRHRRRRTPHRRCCRHAARRQHPARHPQPLRGVLVARQLPRGQQKVGQAWRPAWMCACGSWWRASWLCAPRRTWWQRAVMRRALKWLSRGGGTLGWRHAAGAWAMGQRTHCATNTRASGSSCITRAHLHARLCMPNAPALPPMRLCTRAGTPAASPACLKLWRLRARRAAWPPTPSASAHWSTCLCAWQAAAAVARSTLLPDAAAACACAVLRVCVPGVACQGACRGSHTP